MVNIRAGWKPGEVVMLTSGMGRSSLDELNHMMTQVLFYNGQSALMRAKYLANYNEKFVYWVQVLEKNNPHYYIVLEIQEILDTWYDAWEIIWQRFHVEVMSYWGDDPDILALRTLLN